MGSSQRNKGANGERELAKLLYDRLGVELHRNLDQSRSGGYDIEGLPDFAIEVKRQEKLEVGKWWNQTCEQAEKVNRIPVLAYRQNRRPWVFATTLRFFRVLDWEPYNVEMDIDTFCYVVRERWL